MKKQTWEISGERQEQALYAGFARYLPHLKAEDTPMPSIWPPRRLPAAKPAPEVLEPELVEA
jgi:hypothetical protein